MVVMLEDKVQERFADLLYCWSVPFPSFNKEVYRFDMLLFCNLLLIYTENDMDS